MLAALLTLPDLPVYPVWLGPPHFPSSVVLAIAFAALLATWRSAARVEIAWTTLLCGSTVVVLFEILQLINPARTFELDDILFGIAGISAGTILAYFLIRLLGKMTFASTAMVSTLIVGVSLGYVATQGYSVKNLACGIQASSRSSWDSMLITDFTHNEGASTGDNIGFCVSQDEIIAGNNISYSADLRLVLDGLAEAVRQQRTFVMGIHFTTRQSSSFSEIISFTWQGTATRYFARLSRRGKHLMANLMANLQFNSGEQTRTAMANRVEPGKLLELVMVYDGSQQTTWLNGTLVGLEVTFLNPPTNNTELVLNIGQISDRRSWVPFEGDIKAIYLGTQVLTPAQIQSVFSYKHKP